MGTDANARLGRLQGYLDLDPENLVLLNDALQCALRAGLNHRAEELAKSILHLDPDQEAARCALVLLTSMGERPSGSTADDERPPPRLEPPHDATSTFSLAIDLVAASRLDEATRILEPLLEDRTMPLGEHPALLWLRLMLIVGRAPKAWEWFLGHRTDFRPAGQVASAAALVALECGKYEDGLGLATAVLEVNKLDSEAAFALSSVSLIRGDADGCRRALLPGLEAWRDSRAWLLVALADLLDLRLDSAQVALKRCLGIERDPQALQLLGCLQLMSGNVDGARSALQESAEKDSGSVWLLDMLPRGVAGQAKGGHSFLLTF